MIAYLLAPVMGQSLPLPGTFSITAREFPIPYSAGCQPPNLAGDFELWVDPPGCSVCNFIVAPNYAYVSPEIVHILTELGESANYEFVYAPTHDGTEMYFLHARHPYESPMAPYDRSAARERAKEGLPTPLLVHEEYQDRNFVWMLDRGKGLASAAFKSRYEALPRRSMVFDRLDEYCESTPAVDPRFRRRERVRRPNQTGLEFRTALATDRR